MTSSARAAASSQPRSKSRPASSSPIRWRSRRSGVGRCAYTSRRNGQVAWLSSGYGPSPGVTAGARSYGCYTDSGVFGLPSRIGLRSKRTQDRVPTSESGQ